MQYGILDLRDDEQAVTMGIERTPLGRHLSKIKRLFYINRTLWRWAVISLGGIGWKTAYRKK